MEHYRLIVSENYHSDIKTEPAKAGSSYIGKYI